MFLFNYTSLKTRETRIYDIGGSKISGGIGVDFLKIVVPTTLIAIALGTILGFIFGISFFNPFAENFKLGWTAFWIIFGIGIGCALWYIQFAGYRLYEYLIAYLRPKKVYKNDPRKTQVKFTDVKIKSVVKKIL